MAITVKHSKVSTIPDDADTSLVRPSDWNADHTLMGTVPVANGGTGAATASDGLNNLLPSQTGNNGKVLATDGTNASWTTNGSGDVVGPSSATDNAIARFDGTTGKLIQNSGVTVDDNSNITTNTVFEGFSNTAASGTQIVLTAASVPSYVITGSGGQTIKLPDATTLPNGATFAFNNNQSSGAILVNNNSNTLVVSIPSGAFTIVTLLSNSIAAGSWDTHDQAPANVSWSTNTFNYVGSITGATWNGVAVAINRGGTNASTASTAFNNLSPLTTAGDTLYGGTSGAGTRLAIGTAGQVLTVNSGETAPQWSTPTTGTVTSVGGTGTVSGISLSGTVTSSGNLTLGGTLDLSSPPAIGGTTPAAGTFNTLIGGKSSTTYVTITGDASYPMVQATGGSNTPLVLSPLGTGALQAQKTDSTATGGNARGANAVDWSTIRNTAAQVASASSSTISGGERNTSSGTYGAISGGYTNIASADGSFVGGGSTNTSSGFRSVVGGGWLNTSAGYMNFIGGGYTNSGTALAAVTTQSGTMNGTTSVTLSGSNANIKAGQYITGTSIATNTYVAAISGTFLTLSQNASGSSTSTLSFFTPHGVVVGGGNNQATGSYSFIGGGGDAGTAGNRNAASGDWSTVVGGSKNVASGVGSFIGGGGISVLSTTFGNTASGVSSFVGSGVNNAASGPYSFIGGGVYGNTRSILGYHAFPACDNPLGSTTAGVSQAALLILARQTTDATATVLRSNSATASGINQITLPVNSAFYFRGEVVSGITGGGATKGWTIEGVIKKGATNATTALVGTPTVTSSYADAGAATWALAVTADTTNGSLAVTFTGQAATTIRTVCQIRTTEMGY